MSRSMKPRRRLRAWVLVAAGLGASGLAGCAAGKLNVTVDAYKGPLSNHGETLIIQAGSIAEAARLQLTNLRGSYLTRQEFKAFIPGSEVWTINRILEMYDDPTPEAAAEPVLTPRGAGERATEAVRQIEGLMRVLDQRKVEPEELDRITRQASDLIAWTLGGTVGARTRAEIDQLAYAWVRNRQELLENLQEVLKKEKSEESDTVRAARKRQRDFHHQMVDALTNAGRFRLLSQRIPKTPEGRRGIDPLFDEWLKKLEALRAQAPGQEEEARRAELLARERLLDGFTVVGEAMRALSLVVAGTEFLEKAWGGPERPDDRVDLKLMASMDAFGNALLYAADSARQEAGFSRRLHSPALAPGREPAVSDWVWRRDRGRALDVQRAEFEDQLLKSLAEGVEERGGHLGEKEAEARSKARGLERAIRTAQTMPPPLERLRPAGEYLRAQQPGRILLEALGESNPSLKEATDRLTQAFDNLYWERVNKVEAAGLGKANYVLYKDDIGNWNLKAYSDDRTLLVKAVFGSVIAAADLALAATTGGSTAVTELLRKRIETLKQTSALSSVSAETIRRQIAEARVTLVKRVLPNEQKPETILLTNEKLRTAAKNATAGDAVSQALEEYRRSLTVIRAGVVPASGGP